MIEIRPVSDLRNKFTEIEKIVKEGEPVFLTKNGYGSMVVLSLDAYSSLVDGIESSLNEADNVARMNSARLSHEEVFSRIRSRVNE